MCCEKGGGLSEGQAQRIAIARALLHPGSIIILDEASSALDSDTEEKILKSLMHGMKDKTIIWITHHEAVTQYMDQVLRIEAC
jgi:ABC-type transport system involved in cytochrome bd biosynthesis fused ATPase/permease subunit